METPNKSTLFFLFALLSRFLLFWPFSISLLQALRESKHGNVRLKRNHLILGTSGRLLLRNLKKAFSHALPQAMVRPRFVKHREIIL